MKNCDRSGFDFISKPFDMLTVIGQSYPAICDDNDEGNVFFANFT